MAATIVLADDDDDLRAVYSAYLRRAGHVIWEAVNGREALELVRAHNPQVLVLDVWMPILNGFEVLNELRREPCSARMKIVMLSVMSDGSSRLEGFGGGADVYLVKGGSLADLQATLQEVLDEAEAVFGR